MPICFTTISLESIHAQGVVFAFGAAECQEGLRPDAERRVEAALGRAGGEPADELERFGRRDLAIDAHLLPLDRQRAGVTDPVEPAHELLPVDAAAPHGAEVPAAAAVAEGQVRGEDP